MGRPAPRFRGFIGHKILIDPIRRELAGAKARGEPLAHLLLTGSSGIGKTRLAETLAEQTGTKLWLAMGGESSETLTRKLLALEHSDLLFIDECHRLKEPAQELLFEAIDHRWVRQPPAKDDPKGTQETEKKSEFHLHPFTLVAATDRPGQLLNAFKKRFPTRLHLTPYPLQELKEIVAITASEIGVLLSPQATMYLAKVCHGIPRTAKHFLQKLRHFFPKNHTQLRVHDVEEFLRANHIDKNGLGLQHRRFLRFLGANEKASLETLAQVLSTDKDEVLEQIEPILVRKGLVAIASSGRRLTPKGEKWITSRGTKRKSKVSPK